MCSISEPYQYLDLQQGVAIVGGGLVGSLLAICLRKHRFATYVFESRPDPRVQELEIDKGKSMNLTLTSRGLVALASISKDLISKVMTITTPVRGKTVHLPQSGKQEYIPFGPDKTYCYFSVSRLDLQRVLIDEAQAAGAKFFFNHRLKHVEILEKSMTFQHSASLVSVGGAKHIFGADGIRSRCRYALREFLGQKEPCITQLRHGYKQLTIPSPAAASLTPRKSLHIWPGDDHFIISFPSRDGSHLATLFLPTSTPSDLEPSDFFNRCYADALKFMPYALEEYHCSSLGTLSTVVTEQWAYKDHLVLLGDAAHAMLPFYGQGCNCGFGDVQVLHKLLREVGVEDMETVFATYSELCKLEADSISIITLDEYETLINRPTDIQVLQKEIATQITQRYSCYVSSYQLVTQSLVPYSICLHAQWLQQGMLAKVSRGISTSSEVDYNQVEKWIACVWLPFLEDNRINPEQFHHGWTT